MSERFAGKHTGEHDWHSREYVDNWIASDVTRDSERRPILRQMLRTAPFSHEAEISVLDVGAGYGLFTEEVLRAFPRAHVTLQDYSQPMFEHARKRLAGQANSVSYVLADLCDRSWTERVGGPFDLAVSGLAVHNLRLESLMKRCYRSIFDVLRPGGFFLDYDLFGLVTGGLDTHLGWIGDAGFERVHRVWEQSPLAAIAASVPSRQQ